MSRLLGGMSLDERLHMSPLRTRAGVSDTATSTMAMRWVPIPGFVDGRHDSPQHKDATNGLVLGGLSDGHR